MDAHTFFPLYFSNAVAPARALVDEVFNCDGEAGQRIARLPGRSNGAGQHGCARAADCRSSSATQLDKPALCICSARARLHRLPVRVADLLLNFVVANWTAHSEAGPQAPVQLMRPRRRLDLSRLSGVGEPVAGVAGVAWPCSCAAGSTLAYC